MSRILAKSKDADIKALYKKYGPKFAVAIDQRGAECLFSESLGGVKLDISRARLGNDVYLPHEVAFHEFGHMIDWLSSGRKGYASSGSRIVDAIDRDWAARIGKTAKRNAAAEFAALAKSDPKEAIREIREQAKKDGMEGVVRLCHEARRANSVNRTGWDAIYARLARDDGFAKAVDSLLKSKAEWALRYNRAELNAQAVADLSKLVNEKTKHSFYDASDVIEGATGIDMPLGAGHGGGYFTSEFYGMENRATEFFAEACSAKVMNDGSLATLRELFPTAIDEFERLVKEILEW